MAKATKGTKIAYVSPTDYNLYFFRLSWLKALRREGAETYAVIPEGEYVEKIRDAGIQICIYPNVRGSWNPLRWVQTVSCLSKIFRENQFDVIHLFTFYPIILGTLAAWFARAPCIIQHVTGLGSLYIQAFTAGQKVLKWLSSWAYEKAFRSAQFIIFQNPVDKKQLYENLKIDTPARVVLGSGVNTNYFSPKSVDLDKVTKLKKTFGITEKNIVVSTIARLLKHKGILEFVQAAEKLYALDPRFIFLIIGWEDSANVSALSSEEIKRFKNKPFIKLLGFQSDVRECLALSDIYVLLSYREGLARSVLEAMAMEKPVIVSNVPGCQELIVENKTGFSVDCSDLAMIIEKIQTLAENPNLRKKVGAQARDWVCGHASDEIIYGQIKEIYQKLKLFGD